MLNNNLINVLKDKVIVSCQAAANEPLYSPEALLAMARAAIEGGAAALRAEGTLSIRQMKHFFQVPIIGLIKKNYPASQIYITPTRKDVAAVAIAGADIIAVDATNRKRPNHEKLEDLVDLIHHYHLLAMADISTAEEGIMAEKLGFDLIGTTLAGYTDYSKQIKEPDFTLLTELTQKLSTPIIMEGRIATIEHLEQARQRKAHAVVIGSAITRPQLITRNFTISGRS